MDNSPYYNSTMGNNYFNYYIPPGISMTGYYPGITHRNSPGLPPAIGYYPGTHRNSAFQRYPLQNRQRTQTTTTSSLIFYDPRPVSEKITIGQKQIMCNNIAIILY